MARASRAIKVLFDLPGLPVRTFRTAATVLLPSFVKPGWNVSRRDRASWQMRNDGSGGHDQSLVEFDACKVLGFHFGFERLRRPRAPASDRGAVPREFEGHVPGELLHSMLPTDLPAASSATRSAVMQRDQFGDAGRTLAAFDFDHHVIVDPQAIWRDVLHFRDAGAAPDP
jgi:hypothetical protein